MNVLQNPIAPDATLEIPVPIVKWVEGTPRQVEIKHVFLDAIESARFERASYVKLEFGIFNRSCAGGIVRLWRKRADGRVVV